VKVNIAHSVEVTIVGRYKTRAVLIKFKHRFDIVFIVVAGVSHNVFQLQFI